MQFIKVSLHVLCETSVNNILICRYHTGVFYLSCTAQMSSGSHQQEAAEKLEAIEQVRLNKDAARQLIENREYEPAIKHLTAVIEVSVCYHKMYSNICLH